MFVSVIDFEFDCWIWIRDNADMIWSKEPAAMSGWSEPVESPSANLGIDPMVDTNFAPVILANGSLVGASRGVSSGSVSSKFQL